jgi:hypothetical protein
MATGDANDMAARMRAVLPAGWFPDSAPVLTAILTGFGAVWAQMYSLLAWVRLQTRIATATGANLDLISLDFFGGGLPRRSGESDSVFEARIERELFRAKGTRAAVVRELVDLTGVAPTIFEPALTSDTGGYTTGGVGYGAGGGYGSLLLPFQCFVQAYLQVPAVIANVGGYGNPVYANYGGGYGDGATWPGSVSPGGGAIEYADISNAPGLVTDATIYAAIASVIPTATIAWTAIEPAPSPPDPPGACGGVAAS